MSDEKQNEPAKRSKRWAIVAVLPFVYPISIGPYFWIASFLMSRFGFDVVRTIDTFETIYHPLIWFADGLGLQRPLDWWVALFSS